MSWIVTSEVSLCTNCFIHCSNCRRSPLHISASSAHYLECVHVLVEHGAKIRLADCNGIRPIDLEKVHSNYGDLHLVCLFCHGICC